MAIKHNKVQLVEAEEPRDGDGHNPGNTLLQVKEVAELLGIHPNTVRMWADSGVLKSYRIGPRRDRRIPLAAIRFLLNSR